MTEIVPRRSALRYALVRRLGRGGTAETWLARREGGLFPEDVCIKRSLRYLNQDERRALLEEARLLARIRHANVVQLLDALEDEAGEVCLVLELVRGVDLRVLSRALGRRGRALRPAVVAAVHVSVSCAGRCSARRARGHRASRRYAAQRACLM